VRFELDLAERGFVLVNVLREDVEQCLGLLGAEVNPLEILNVDVVGSGLVDQAEEQEEVPEIYADLDAIGIGLAVVWQVAHLDFGWLRLAHMDMVTQSALCARGDRPGGLSYLEKVCKLLQPRAGFLRPMW
jgi:hypothetical protein